LMHLRRWNWLPFHSRCNGYFPIWLDYVLQLSIFRFINLGFRVLMNSDDSL
jgi:hypothetical protein